MSDVRRGRMGDGRHGDEGSALVLVLGFITMMGLIVVAVLSYSFTSFRVSVSTADIEKRTFAADGGAKFGLAHLVDAAAAVPPNPADPVAEAAAIKAAVDTACSGIGTGPPSNGFTPTVTCATRNGTIFTRSTGWGVYIDDPGGQIATQSAGGPNNEKRRIDGPVYNHSTTSAWDLNARLLVSDGGVLQRITSSGCVPDARLILRGSGSYACTPPVDEPTIPPPTQRIPNSPADLATRNPAGDGGAACRVFEPGWYGTAPQLVDQNYFKSGVYFFEAGIGEVRGQDILAGSPPLTETTVMTDLASMPCAVTEASGVQFIFGGAGYLFSHNGARVEIHSMARGDTSGTSIYRVRASDGSAWSPYASTLTGLANPVVRSGQGGDANLVVHGLIYLPGGALDLEGKQSDLSQVRGGVVAGSVRLQASASMVDPGVQISAGEPVTVDQQVITATVNAPDGKVVTVKTVVRIPADDPTNPIIYSWVVG